MVDLSVIIPSYKDPLLFKTIESIFENFRTDFEIIPVIDGYSIERSLAFDKRIRPVFHVENRGMREAINSGVMHSSGRYIMRTDEHCIFAEGFDRTILETIEDNWIVTARRYKLDPEKWEIMKDRPVDYEKMVILNKSNGIHKFSGVQWISRERERQMIMLDETMCMQGSCWTMARSWWDRVIGRLQTEGYGPHYQDSTEMIFKTWKAGGKLMVNKNTWFAHKHRRFNRTHQYPTEKAIPEWKYALDMWEPYYQEVIRKKWNL